MERRGAPSIVVCLVRTEICCILASFRVCKVRDPNSVTEAENYWTSEMRLLRYARSILGGLTDSLRRGGAHTIKQDGHDSTVSSWSEPARLPHHI